MFPRARTRDDGLLQLLELKRAADGRQVVAVAVVKLPDYESASLGRSAVHGGRMGIKLK